MRRFFTPLCVRLYLLLAACLAVNFAWPHVLRSEWNRERLYRQVLAGTDKERIAAAEQLVRYDGQEQLLKALRSDSLSIRTVAVSALFDLWMAGGSEEAALILRVADSSMERKNVKGALNHLTRLTRTHPFFAEGWNRRATLLWQLGEVEKALADCRKAVLLNPDHFAAWQGMGMCHLRLGDLPAAVKAFQNALKLMPHDRGTLRNLQWCEEMIRRDKLKEKPAPVEEIV